MKKIFNILTVNLFIIILILIIFEIIFGSWFFKRNFDTHIQSLTNLEIPINIKVNSKEYKFKYIRNNLGFRSSKNIEPKDIKVVFQGGSTGNEMFVPEDLTIVELLNSKFKLKKNKIEIVNASYDGKTTRGYIYDFYNWFDKIDNFNPQIIIFLYRN